MILRTLALSLLVPATSLAQQKLTVPAAYDDAEASSNFALAGFTFGDGQQILIDREHLQPMVGRSIVGITFRRDSQFRRALRGRQANLVIRIGPAPHRAAAASRMLTQNISNPIEVFRGLVTIPDAPTIPGFVGWDPPNSVRIAFTTPFSYQGGELCVWVEGTPVGRVAGYWPMDAIMDPVRGSVSSFGSACGPYSDGRGQTAHVDAASLVVGETAQFHNWGTPNGSGFFLIGLTLLPSPIDLGFLGAPGCNLYVDSLAATPTTFGPAEFGAEFGGTATVGLGIPANHGLLGARFVLQWVELSGQIRTSNALDCAIASVPPTLGVSTTSAARGSGEGYVSVQWVPVMRFDYR